MKFEMSPRPEETPSSPEIPKNEDELLKRIDELGKADDLANRREELLLGRLGTDEDEGDEELFDITTEENAEAANAMQASFRKVMPRRAGSLPPPQKPRTVPPPAM